MDTPLFSIIIPTYNRAWILPRTLHAIVKQDCSDWELIVVDDGSTDQTEAIVYEMMEHVSNVHYIKQDNAGQAAARQTGLEQATGEWVTYVDSDEEVYPFYLSKAKEWFEAHPKVSYAFAWNDRVLELHDEYHNVLTTIQEPATQLPLDAVTLRSFANWEIKPCGTGIFHKRSIVRGDIRWDTSFHLMEDIDFLFQLGLQYPKAFGFIPRALFKQQQVFGAEGVCSNASYTDWADAFEMLYTKYADTWLMSEQQWYPKKVETYRERQRLYEAGELPSNVVRIFADYYNEKKD